MTRSTRVLLMGRSGGPSGPQDRPRWGARAGLAMWLLRRAHEHIPNYKPTTSKPKPRRNSLIKPGISAFTTVSKQHRVLTLPTPSLPRVLDYQRTFGPL